MTEGLVLPGDDALEAANKLKPVIDKTFGFGELQNSIRYLKSGSHFGKVVVEVA